MAGVILSSAWAPLSGAFSALWGPYLIPMQRRVSNVSQPSHFMDGSRMCLWEKTLAEVNIREHVASLKGPMLSGVNPFKVSFDMVKRTGLPPRSPTSVLE